MDTRENNLKESVSFNEHAGRTKAGIIAALEREIKPAVKSWRVSEQEHEGRIFRIYECERARLICGGIGAEAARRAAQAMVTLCRPDVLVSLGFAGALDSGLKIGDSFLPRFVRDAGDNSVVDTATGAGTLVSFGSIVSAEQKAKLGQSYRAQAVDMEAAAVARVAEAHGVRFMAVKAISDDKTFDMPDLSRFVRNGEFFAARFMAHCALRPWLWPQVLRLAKNSARAAKTLSAWLSHYNQTSEFREFVSPSAHLISKPKN